MEKKPLLAAEHRKKKRQKERQSIVVSLREFSQKHCNLQFNQKPDTSDLVLEPAWQGNFIFDWAEIKINKR